MRVGGLAWFVVGVLVGALWRWEHLGVVFRFVVTVVTGAVSFLGAVGTAALLLITALAFWGLTRTWTERARAQFDMDRTWRQRRNYRLPPNQRL